MLKIDTNIKNWTNSVHGEAMVFESQTGKNLEFIDEAEEVILEMQEHCRKHSFKSLVKKEFWERDDSKILIERLSIILSKRFNIGFDIDCSTFFGSYNACAYLVLVDLPLSKEHNKYLKDVKKWIKDFKKEIKEELDNGNELDYDQRRWDNMADNIDKQLKEVSNQILRGMLGIDVKNIKFVGAENVKVNVCIDIAGLTLSPGHAFTPREMLGVLMHEIGHIFESVYSLNSQFRYNTNLYEEIEHLARKGKNIKEICKVLYKNDKELIPGGDNIDNKNEFICLAKFVKGLLSRQKTVGVNKTESLNREIEADKFAINFHLGLDLTTALDKMYKDNARITKVDSNISYLVINTLIPPLGPVLRWLNQLTLLRIAALLIKIHLRIALDLAFTPIFLLFDIIISPILYITGRYDFEMYRKAGNRLKLVRDQTLKQLKKLDPKTNADLYNRLIEELDEMDGYIKDYGGNGDIIFKNSSAHIISGIVTCLISYISSNHKRMAEIYNLEHRLEDLTNNNLYLGSAKLKSLGGNYEE